MVKKILLFPLIMILFTASVVMPYFSSKASSKDLNLSFVASDEVTPYGSGEDEDTLYFGSYPQSKVTDSSLISSLNSLAGDLPTSENSNRWTSYEYFLGTGASNSGKTDPDFMWYQDITYLNNKYRGIYFVSYRPDVTNQAGTEGNTYQDNYGYSKNTVYWFLYEPIKWKILSIEGTQYFLVSDLVLDAHEFYDNTKMRGTVNPNNYKDSNIRAWLNDSFYNTAFEFGEKHSILTTEVDNSAATTDSESNQFVCENTFDNVFLLSYQDIFNSEYFADNNSRIMLVTEYAKSQCSYVRTATNSNRWWTRTPTSISNVHSVMVEGDGGSANNGHVYNVHCGVVPAIVIEKSELETETSITFGSYPQTKVTDSSLISSLTSLAGTLPTNGNNRKWTSYKYYASNSNATDYMWFQDIEYNGDKYRGVYFTNYVPIKPDAAGSTDNSYQDENGYLKNTVYWFKFEPLHWTVLRQFSNKLFIVAENIVDSRYFNHTTASQNINGQTAYAANYEYSEMRTWLNSSFYDTAFDYGEKNIIQTTEVDNRLSSTNNAPENFLCNNTLDKVFLLSYAEAFNSNYFANDAARKHVASDYAKAQGCYVASTATTHNWWLRSPNPSYSSYVAGISHHGMNSQFNCNNTYQGVLPAIVIEKYKVVSEEKTTPVYTVDENNENLYYFGSYPQTKVTDSSLISTLNAFAGTLPTNGANGNWTSYGYYVNGSNATDYMWYIDVFNGDEKYRGVYFTGWRPVYTTEVGNDTGKTEQDNNGYSLNTVYWFKWEPLCWKKLTSARGKIMLVCKTIIDSQAFNSKRKSIANHGVYSNNYAASDIRAWLNEDFYNIAFNENERQLIDDTVVDNSQISANPNINPKEIGDGVNDYVCENTLDKIFLLSINEITNEAYGFNTAYDVSDVAKKFYATDYAKSQGCHVESGNKASYWLLRTPTNDINWGVRYVTSTGNIGYRTDAVLTYQGTLPALVLDTNRLPEEKDESNCIKFGTYPQSRVTDTGLLKTLDIMVGELPTNGNNKGWTSYNYYLSGSNTTDFMWYKDVAVGSSQFRGVYFKSYRLMDTMVSPDYDAGDTAEERNEKEMAKSYQDDNGYYKDTVYWFKWEPVKWRVISTTDGVSMLLCENIIDSQEYNHTSNNNYAYSSIREWLNYEFCQTTFNAYEIEMLYEAYIDNSVESTISSLKGTGNKFACENTIEKVSLLSFAEVRDEEFFDNIEQKRIELSEYAKVQGAKNGGGVFAGKGSWWLRSPGFYNNSSASGVSEHGYDTLNDVKYTFNGVVPVIYIAL